MLADVFLFQTYRVTIFPQVVNGSDQITLFLVNSSFFDVAVPGAFNLSCSEHDEPLRCSFPAAYIYAVEPWDAASSASNVTLAVRGVSHVMAGTGVQLTMAPSCVPGFTVNTYVTTNHTKPRLELPFSFFPVANLSQLCQSCRAGSFSNLWDTN